jgi:TonB family protein
MKITPCAALFGAGLLASVALAQDVTVGEVVWFETAPPPTTLPQPRHRLRPDYPKEMRESSEFGYVIIADFVDSAGKRLSMVFSGTHPPLQREVSAVMSDWELKPGMQDGKPVNGRIWVPVIFNPKSAAAKGSDATPRLLAVAPAFVAPRPTPDGVPPVIHMKLSLDASGAITRAVPQEASLKPAALEAIQASLRHWRFAPARKDGQAVAAEVTVPVLCEPPLKDEVSHQTPPKVISRTPPEYPFSMRRYGLGGHVVVEFEVNPQGKVQNAVVTSSDNPAFDDSAIRAVRQWVFEPGRQDGEPNTQKLRSPVIFQLAGVPGGGDSAFRVSTRGDQSKLPPELRFDTPPSFRGVVIPVYPYELRRDGIRGKARVTALINQRGRVSAVKVQEADRPEFGFALATAMEGFTFAPALKDSHPVQHLMAFEQNFSARDLPDDVGDNLLSLEKRHPERILDDHALAAPLKPLSQARARFPKSLLGTLDHGEAVVEVLIDEDGRVRLPRVVSASDPAFGYAAVQSVSSWWFEPPKVAGKFVVVRTRLPVTFDLKTTPAEANPAPAPDATPAAP